MNMVSLELCMPGNFSIYNSLCAIAVTRHFNVDEQRLKKALYDVRVRGRIDIVDLAEVNASRRDFTIMVDYAHNAMALESLLKTLKEYNPKRIVTVFGCGGNRDRDRRFEMAQEPEDYPILRLSHRITHVMRSRMQSLPI